MRPNISQLLNYSFISDISSTIPNFIPLTPTNFQQNSMLDEKQVINCNVIILEKIIIDK